MNRSNSEFVVTDASGVIDIVYTRRVKKLGIRLLRKQKIKKIFNL
jgi:hypothetical protein